MQKTRQTYNKSDPHHNRQQSCPHERQQRRTFESHAGSMNAGRSGCKGFNSQKAIGPILQTQLALIFWIHKRHAGQLSRIEPPLHSFRVPGCALLKRDERVVSWFKTICGDGLNSGD